MVTEKTKKQRTSVLGKPGKQVCGTLSYLAERRGARAQAESSRWPRPPDGTEKLVRK